MDTCGKTAAMVQMQEENSVRAINGTWQALPQVLLLLKILNYEMVSLRPSIFIARHLSSEFIPPVTGVERNTCIDK